MRTIIEFENFTLKRNRPFISLTRPQSAQNFAARTREKPLSGVSRIDNILVAARRGAEVGAAGSLAARALTRRRGISAGKTAVAGALVGAVANGALQYERDRQRNLSSRIGTLLFESIPVLQTIQLSIARSHKLSP